jgi:serine protease Do
MPEKRDSFRTWIIVAVIIALLASCGISVIVGGAVGYLAGKRAAQEVRRELPGPTAFPVPRVPTPAMPPVDLGVMVVGVVAGSPAERAGLQAGDLIVAVNGESVTFLEDESLEARIAQYNPGDRVELQIMRRGQERTIEVQLGRNPERGGDTAWLGVYYRAVPFSQAPGGSD